MPNLITTPVDPHAQQGVKNVLQYLAEISGTKIITGQHTQSMAQEEMHHIQKITGKLPALLGFELLSYSPNINYLDTDEACMKEVEDNFGTLKRAWEWATQKGLITLTWHWFSPLGGRSKAFYTVNTDFDASRAVMEGTPEYEALLSDMDMMAALLKPFCRAGIPILWRPFHEGEGGWFWWGAKGPQVLQKLWRIMYDRYVNHHHLHNLLWVWNAPKRECYPGDDVVDIISRDMYPEKHCHTSQKEKYDDLLKITDAPKVALIGETGTLPSPEAIHEEKVGWTSYMTWSHGFCLTEEFNTFDVLKQVYSSPWAITKETLPQLY